MKVHFIVSVAQHFIEKMSVSPNVKNSVFSFIPPKVKNIVYFTDK